MVQAFLSVLRQPRLILGEIAVIGVMAAMGAVFPQAGSASEAELAALRSHGRVVALIVELFSLDHVFQSAWFAAATAIAAASLLVTGLDQVRRFRAAWAKPLTEDDFIKATFRTEFDRPARGLGAGAGAGGRVVDLKTEGRLGLAGAPVFHGGLLLVVIAGTVHALFGVHAIVDLIEGETLPPTAEAWSAQWPGVLAKPLRLRDTITLNRVTSVNYEAGDQRDLQVQLSLNHQGIVRSAEMAVNHDLHVPGGRLYLGSDFGPAPMIEWRSAGGPPMREAPLLTREAKSIYEGSSSPSDGIRAYIRAHMPLAGARPDRIEVRVMKEHALLFTDTVRVGAVAPLADGLEMQLHGIPFWARLHGSHDPALWLAYLGFVFVLIGATLMFAVIKIDTCVAVSSIGENERVFVALKAQRLGPVFEERFSRLVRSQGGAT